MKDGLAAQTTMGAVGSSALILIEAPSSAVPPWDCWRWAEQNNLKRRSPQAILPQTAQILLWH
jgi:hypothetical protein